jgi:hypothetical protein
MLAYFAVALSLPVETCQCLAPPLSSQVDQSDGGLVSCE